MAPALSFGEFRHHFATREKLLSTYVVEVRIYNMLPVLLTIDSGSGNKTNLGSVLVLLYSQESVDAPSFQDYQFSVHSVLYCLEDPRHCTARVVIDHR